ncbi:MAG: hypothetical protein JWM53_4593 [bacterium]|jgi:hypothetical protein|nr:hypothetical protein [bacterium]
MRRPASIVVVAVAAVAGVLLVSSLARAEDRVEVKAEYFTEPANKQALHVFHPAAAVDVDAHRDFTLRFGYDADVVSGATPRTYGSLDAVSSATSFSDTRHAFHGGAQLRLGPTSVDAGYTYGFENDYRSHALDIGAKVDLWGKNTTFRLGYSHNFDSVCNVDNKGAMVTERRSLGDSKGCFGKTVGLVAEALAIDSYAASWTQVLTPILLSDLSVTFQVLDGFQSNPYRRVRLFGTVEAQESEPLLRQRVAVQARFRLALPRARGALGILGRFYWDTWGIKSGTAEITWDEWVHPQLLLRLRGRFYQQSRALFYRDAGETLSYESVGPVGQYFTGDRELSPFRDYLVGFKVAWVRNADERGKVWRFFEQLDLNAKIDLIDYQPLTPAPPNQARNVGLVNALVAELGLALRW